MSLIVICPSRGRPTKAREAYDAFEATRSLDDTKMVFVVDADDDTFIGYVKQQVPVATYKHEGGGMGPPLNVASAEYSQLHDIVGFVGDDHRFRTQAWDAAITKALETPGFAYGDDRIRHDIPSQVFISSGIVRTLGWMSLPGAKHLYLDDAWRVLAQGVDRYFYLPDVVIEHCHPIAGTAEMDEGYARVNAHSMYLHDSRVFNEWVSSGRAAMDIETIRASL